LEVLVDHSTENRSGLSGYEGGELLPQGPTVGKVKQGMTIYRKERREGLRAHKPCHQKADRVCRRMWMSTFYMG